MHGNAWEEWEKEEEKRTFLDAPGDSQNENNATHCILHFTSFSTGMG
jgi:hypothetical protein